MTDTIFKEDIELSIFAPYNINCKDCCGLCCVSLYFTKSDGFPKDKKAGIACKNLQTDYKCQIHSELFKQGLKGCIAYDCFGAGQFLTRQLASLPDWLTLPPREADKIFNAYLIVLNIHHTLWYVAQCMILRLPGTEAAKAQALIDEGHLLIENPLEILTVLDTQTFCDKANVYLKHISKLYLTKNSVRIKGKDFIGKNMRQKDLSGADFSMSLMIAADLEQANLYGTNFLGADLRDTNVCNTDLSQCLFLTQIQVNGAKGNANTVLPPYLNTPKTWSHN